MDRPTKLRVGAFDYSIDWKDGNWTASTGNYGECDFTPLAIRVNGALPSERLRATFVHEVTHAGWDALGYAHADDSTVGYEAVCIFSGNFWPMFWRDNPEALKWWLSLIQS
jgi:hypothetical protein